jgi:hypothetical protein
MDARVKTLFMGNPFHETAVQPDDRAARRSIAHPYIIIFLAQNHHYFRFRSGVFPKCELDVVLAR